MSQLESACVAVSARYIGTYSPTGSRSDRKGSYVRRGVDRTGALQKGAIRRRTPARNRRRLASAVRSRSLISLDPSLGMNRVPSERCRITSSSNSSRSQERAPCPSSSIRWRSRFSSHLPRPVPTWAETRPVSANDCSAQAVAVDRRRRIGAGAVPRIASSTRKETQSIWAALLRRSSSGAVKPTSTRSAWPPCSSRLYAISSKLPKSYGGTLKSATPAPYAISHNTRISAKNDVFPVLFSPIRRVSGARRAVCSSWKHRKSLRVISDIMVLALWS